MLIPISYQKTSILAQQHLQIKSYRPNKFSKVFYKIQFFDFDDLITFDSDTSCNFQTYLVMGHTTPYKVVILISKFMSKKYCRRTDGHTDTRTHGHTDTRTHNILLYIVDDNKIISPISVVMAPPTYFSYLLNQFKSKSSDLSQK